MLSLVFLKSQGKSFDPWMSPYKDAVINVNNDYKTNFKIQTTNPVNQKFDGSW